MRSIRSYLLSRLLGGAALVLGVTGIAVYVVVARALEGQFDRNLANRVQGLASILFQVEDVVDFAFSDELMPEYEREELPAFFELRFDDGTLLERSNSAGETALEVPRPPTEVPVYWDGPLPDGRPGRFVAQRIEIHHVFPETGPDRPDARRLSIVVARGREELVAGERAILQQCVGAALLLMGSLTVLILRSVKRGLAPAHRVAAALDAIHVDDLPETLDFGPLPRELAPVGEKTQALVQRVDRALEQERRTAADIAHELRTPISELLTVSEVALREDRDPQAAHQALRTVRDVASRMGRSVSTLLKLAWLEMGADSSDHVGVDLGAIVRDALRPLAAVQRERELRVENRVDSGPLVEADEDVVRIVVSNLVANAVTYAPSRGSIRCLLERTDGNWMLVVENAAGELSAEDLASLSRPFWRKDRARSDRNRFGLGLALSCALSARAGMKLAFELRDGNLRASLSGATEGFERTSRAG